MIEKSALYRTLWRWHFYAGLCVIPFILILSVTGALYLFKPQIDRWEERAFTGLPMANTVSANAQLDAALAAYPGAQFHSYRLPEVPGDAAMVHLELEDGETMVDVFVSPHGKVLGSIAPDWRISRTLSRIHGSLLLGRAGDIIVELAACWAMVMIVSGLYLWWPSGRRAAGVIWPRRGRSFLRDLHAVTGFWVSGLALILLLTGLPWSNVWGDAFGWARTQMGWVKGAESWETQSHSAHTPHVTHDHEAMLSNQGRMAGQISLAKVVNIAHAQNLPFPVRIMAPGTWDWSVMADPQRWTVQSMTQNRPQRVTIQYDIMTGKEVFREAASDKHIIDRAVNYGIAWHEGQLFGWVNQMIGLFTAIALITLAISGFVMWRRRKPQQGIGAPPISSHPMRKKAVAVTVLILAAVLPLLAISLILLWLFDRLMLPRLPRFANWMGMTEATH